MIIQHNTESRLRLHWRLSLVVLSLAACRLAIGDDFAIAAEHRAANYPKTEWPYIYYFTSATYPQDKREQLVAAANFIFAGSSSQDIVERCTLHPIGDTLHVIDIRDMQWEWKQFAKVLESYPYRHWYTRINYGGVKYAIPLLLRMDWLIVELTDCLNSDAHYRLLYNNADINRDEVLKFWKTNTDPKVHYAIPEGDSGVSVQKKRWLVSQANAIRTYAFGTLDYLQIEKEDDPLENLDYPLRGRFEDVNHDGEEWIIGMPKFSLKERKFGCLQAYLLSDGAGKRVEEGPGALVRADHSYRGYSTITNNGGCINCHKTGLNPSTVNEAVQLAADGVVIYSKDKDLAIDVERLVFRSPSEEITVANSLYATGCELICGMKPAEATKAFLASVSYYDAPVTLDQAALELYCEPKDLQSALAWKQTFGVRFGARLSKLAQGKGPIPRPSWESDYYTAYTTLQAWREATE